MAPTDSESGAVTVAVPSPNERLLSQLSEIASQVRGKGRCVPWDSDEARVLGHLHRYLVAWHLARDRRVLDLGSGEGFGAELLATVASSVVAIDLDSDAVLHARATHHRENLSFIHAESPHLAGLVDGSFDLLLNLGTPIETGGEAALVEELSRLCSPDGVVLLSTGISSAMHTHGAPTADRGPLRRQEREAGSDPRLGAGLGGVPSPLRDSGVEELAGLLGKHFAHVATLSQVVGAASVIDHTARSSTERLEGELVSRHNGRLELTAVPRPERAVLLVASRRPLALAGLATTLAWRVIPPEDRPFENELGTLDSFDHERLVRYAASLELSYASALESAREARLAAAVAHSDAEVIGLANAALEEQAAALREELASLRRGIEVARMAEELARLREETERQARALALVQASRGWRALEQIRRVRAVVAKGHPAPEQ